MAECASLKNAPKVGEVVGGDRQTKFQSVIIFCTLYLKNPVKYIFTGIMLLDYIIVLILIFNIQNKETKVNLLG